MYFNAGSIMFENTRILLIPVLKHFKNLFLSFLSLFISHPPRNFSL